MGHHHTVKGKNLFITIVLNAGISVAELAGGIFTGSISLISDAVHNFSDVISLVISYVTNRLAKRDATLKYTFGYKRGEIVAAFVNAATLIILAIFIFLGAIKKLISPVAVNGDIIIILSLLSILVNAASVLFIKGDAKHSMNIKSAYLHLLGDMMTSIIVFAGGILIKYFHIYSVDAIFSLVIAVYLVVVSWKIFWSSLKIIMQFTPEGIDIQDISNKLTEIEGIKNIHHVHVWQIDEHNIMFEAHVDLEQDINISSFEEILYKAKQLLIETNGIYHITLQPEFSVEDKKEVIFC